MKDFLGKELAIGDRVAIVEPRYRNLVSGKVIEFTTKKTRVEFGAPCKYSGKIENVLRDSEYIVKISN